MWLEDRTTGDPITPPYRWPIIVLSIRLQETLLDQVLIFAYCSVVLYPFSQCIVAKFDIF